MKFFNIQNKKIINQKSKKSDRTQVKTSYKKKCLAGILALSMALSFTSCKNIKDSSSYNTSDKASNSTYSSESDSKSEIDYSMIYKNFTEKIDNYLKKSDFQGSVLVAFKDDIIFNDGYGLSDQKNPSAGNNTAHSTFEIGSITKQMTAACILQLEEQGKLSTSDTLDKYFPQCKYGNQITLDMLLHMRSGLVDHINDMEKFYGEKVADELTKDEENCIPVDEGIVLKYFYNVPQKTTPDTIFDYCNMNYYLLGCIVEQVSGEDYGTYIREHIFNVCNMTESNVDFQGTTTKGYDEKGRYYSIPKATVKGAGEVNSSVIDLYKWDRALQSGKVLGDEAYKKMTTEVGGYACGLFAGGGSLSHGGLTDVFNAYNIMFEKDGMIIVVLTNCPDTIFIAKDIAINIRKIWESSL